MSRTHEDIHDELLVLCCQEGDGEALRTLIGRWHGRLGRLAWRMTGEREAARDVMQDTWMAIVRGINRLDDPARFRSWAYRIVANKCADWTRRRVADRNAVRQFRDESSPADNRPNDVNSHDTVARLRAAMSTLPGEQRAVLSLHYIDGMPVGEIARVIGIATGTVKSRLHHARSKLKRMMERAEP